MQLNIIYIMGYGRSGSTLLDIILGNHSEIESLGEVAFLHQDLYQGGLCSCLNSYADCPFWSQVLQKHLKAVSPHSAKDLDKLIRDVEGVFPLSLLFLCLLLRQKVEGYRQCTCSLFEAIL